MLSSVLRSKRAAQVNIEIMRAFVRFRQLLTERKRIGFVVRDRRPRYGQGALTRRTV